MNERIKELSAEAWRYANNYIGEDVMPQLKRYEQKFAELIVRECAQRCDEVIKEVEIAIEQCEVVKTSDRLMMLHDGTRNGAHMAKHRFTKHFGVEE